MTASRYILDTGPLVAFFNSGDRHHQWAVDVLSALSAPPLTTEAVITEVCWHLRTSVEAVARVLEMPGRGELKVVSLTASEGVNLAGKVRKYGARMDYADACVLRLAELTAGSVVITTDVKDFSIYRMHRDDAVPVLTPA
jgi:predicted nucleic acid-binding protein